jgi:hypothetical protein
MASLEVWNDVALVAVFHDTKVNFQVVLGGVPNGRWLTRRKRLVEANAEVFGEVPFVGVHYYVLPTIFESLCVRREGNPAPLFEEQAGRLPQVLEDPDFDMYPCLHFLEERRVSEPWRMERWYTLIGPHLVFECNQYFERPLKGQRDTCRQWERIVSELRQVVDIVTWGAGEEFRSYSVMVTK